MTIKTPTPHANPVGQMIFMISMLLLLSLIVVCGIVLFKAHERDKVIGQTKAEAFQRWVEWRAEHCRFQGTLGGGNFVCDNGVTYRAASGRYGEIRRYPHFVDGKPEAEYVQDRR